MCYWVGTKKVREEMLRRLEQNPEDEIAQLFYKTFVGEVRLPFREHYVAIGKARPEISVLTPGNAGRTQFQNMKWGLPWSYTNAKTGKTISREMINSTAEKAFFVHRNIIFKKRCVIPLDGYYEFFHFTGEVYPHFIKPREGILFAGGVWDEHVNTQTGEISHRFSIITTPPNPLAKRLHNNPRAPNGPRMLLLLEEQAIPRFLDPKTDKDALKSLFKPFDENQLEAYPVARFLRKEFADKINTPEVRKPVNYPQLSLS